jgi:hypothetical protein
MENIRTEIYYIVKIMKQLYNKSNKYKNTIEFEKENILSL